MLLSARAPIVAGCAAMAFLIWVLYQYSPMPAELSGPHAQLPGVNNLQGCEQCHSDQGLSVGCLGCHVEIRSQLDQERGYHHFLHQEGGLQCSECHAEHFGSDFALVNPNSWRGEGPDGFRHPHLDFGLVGSHEQLDCLECHDDHRHGEFSLPGFADMVRPRTYLGLQQDCQSCHSDPHADGLVQNCGECHGQEQFSPPDHFDHSQHFAFVGAHQDLECRSCHDLPAADSPPAPHPFPFSNVSGNDCSSCHETPHHTVFEEDCDRCHAVEEEHWNTAVASMTAPRHAQVGFLLDAPHDQLGCEQCHPVGLSYELRHPDPATPGYLRQRHTCQGCHDDVHRGQFEGRHDACLDCHELHAFLPPDFDAQRHGQRFALLGAHAETDCHDCHRPNEEEVRQFVGTAHACKLCHADPHAGQFAEELQSADCTACHSIGCETFAIRPFDHPGRTGFDLLGAHQQVDCQQCHIPMRFEVAAEAVVAHRYVGTPTQCVGCHDDVHQGQFEASGRDCLDCHDAHFFRPTTFTQAEHNTIFPLVGAHAAIACTRCHTNHAEGSARRFVGTESSCQKCHQDPHAGQFEAEIDAGDCKSCHGDLCVTFQIRPFEHQENTGFELLGAHARADCRSCHIEVTYEHAGRSVQANRFRQTPTACADCHSDVHRGQFAEYESCSTCHVSCSQWQDIQFDHNRQSRFTLEGAHLQVACAQCHQSVPQEDGSEVVQYKPLGRECRDCHEADPNAPETYRRDR